MFNLKDKSDVAESSDKKKLLVGYIPVPSAEWANIVYKSHIRYIKSDGTFVRGGFVKNYWTDKNGSSMIQLENNLNRSAPGYATWAMNISQTQAIYKKCDKSISIEHMTIDKKLNQHRTTINALIDTIHKLDKRLKILESK